MEFVKDALCVKWDTEPFFPVPFAWLLFAYHGHAKNNEFHCDLVCVPSMRSIIHQFIDGPSGLIQFPQLMEPLKKRGGEREKARGEVRNLFLFRKKTKRLIITQKQKKLRDFWLNLHNGKSWEKTPHILF